MKPSCGCSSSGMRPNTTGWSAPTWRALYWLPAAPSLAEAENRIRAGLGRLAEGSGFDGGIFERDTLVGFAGLFHVDPGQGSGELGYWLDQAAEGRGLVTQRLPRPDPLWLRRTGLAPPGIALRRDQRPQPGRRRAPGFPPRGPPARGRPRRRPLGRLPGLRLACLRVATRVSANWVRPNRVRALEPCCWLAWRATARSSKVTQPPTLAGRPADH